MWFTDGSAQVLALVQEVDSCRVIVIKHIKGWLQKTLEERDPFIVQSFKWYLKGEMAWDLDLSQFMDSD